MLVEKRQFFNQNKQWLNNISLNSRFIVLDGIICFSVRFCDNSLLALKIHFQIFSFASKKVKGFSSNRKFISCLSVLFHLQNHVSVFWNFNFSQDIWGNVYFPEINLITYDSNSFLNLNLHDFVDERQLKTVMWK